MPVVTTLHDATFFTHPDVHLPVKRRVLPRPGPGSRCAGPAGASSPVGGHPRRAGPGRRRACRPGRRRPPRRRPGALPRADRRRAGRRPGAPGPAAGRYVAFLGTIEPRKNVAGPDRAAGCRRSAGTWPTRRRWCSPAGAAGTTRSTRSPRRCPPGSTLLLPGLPAAGPAGRLPRRRRGGRLPEPRRGLRAAGARGDGLRRGRC